MIDTENEGDKISLYELYLRLTSAVMVGKLDENIYHYCIFSAFSNEAVYLMNFDKILDAVS